MELRQKRAHAKQRAISRIFDQIQLTSLMNSSCRFYHDAPLHRSTRSSVVLLLTVTMLVPFIGPVSAFDMMTRSRPASLGACTSVVSSDQGKPGIVRCGFYASEDAFVDNLIPTKRFGALIPYVLIVQDTPTVPRSENYAYLKFDLSSLSSLLPETLVEANAVPSNVTLWAYTRYVSLFYNSTIEVHRVLTNNWNETTLTWNNKPTFEKAGYDLERVAANGTWVAWNVTEDFSSGISGRNEVSYMLKASETHWKNIAWFDAKDEPQHANMTTKPELDLDFAMPIFTIDSQYANLPVTIEQTGFLASYLPTVDRQTYGTDINGIFKAIVPWGAYAISVPEVIPLNNVTKAVFVGWNDNVREASRTITISRNTILQPAYRLQYDLSVSSPYASTSGSGWYFEGTNASLSVNPDTVPAEGLAGVFGVRHVFDHWTGDCTNSESKCVVIMNISKSATAVWRDDYTVTIAFSAALLVIAFAATMLVLRRRRKSASQESKSQ